MQISFSLTRKHWVLDVWQMGYQTKGLVIYIKNCNGTTCPNPTVFEKPGLQADDEASKYISKTQEKTTNT